MSCIVFANFIDLAYQFQVFIAGKNGLSAQHRSDFLDNLRAVANSSDITVFEEAVKELENSQWYTSNAKARNYVQNKWLNIAKVFTIK